MMTYTSKGVARAIAAAIIAGADTKAEMAKDILTIHDLLLEGSMCMGEEISENEIHHWGDGKYQAQQEFIDDLSLHLEAFGEELSREESQDDKDEEVVEIKPIKVGDKLTLERHPVLHSNSVAAYKVTTKTVTKVSEWSNGTPEKFHVSFKGMKGRFTVNTKTGWVHGEKSRYCIMVPVK